MRIGAGSAMVHPRSCLWSCVLAALFLVSFPGTGWAFQTNLHVWPSMPVQYYVNPEHCPVLESGVNIFDIVAEAAATWGAVPCSEASFEFAGTTLHEWEKDGLNTVFCIDDSNGPWPGPKGAAGATLWLPTAEDEPMEVDLALNAVDFKWIIGGGDPFLTDNIDPVAVVTHELGHWLGLSHSDDPFATMFFAHLPWGLQKTLAGDDKAAICTLYPSGTDECQTDSDCPGEDFYCKTIESIPVCEEKHDGPGAPCSKEMIDCDGMCWDSFYDCKQICLFTSADYSTGYCSPLCNREADCPAGFECVYVEEYDISICVEGFEIADKGPEEYDAGPAIEAVDAADVTPEEIFIIEVVEPDSTDQIEIGRAETTNTAVADSAVDLPADAPGSDLYHAAGVRRGSRGGCSSAGEGSFSSAFFVVLLALLLAGLRFHVHSQASVQSRG